ncbi:MAG: Ig-like domain-containing protein [Ruminococcus sp.]|nr:Ig-like domain-containing protein [Ruminococcus sp.]
MTRTMKRVAAAAVALAMVCGYAPSVLDSVDLFSTTSITAFAAQTTSSFSPRTATGTSDGAVALTGAGFSNSQNRLKAGSHVLTCAGGKIYSVTVSDMNGAIANNNTGWTRSGTSDVWTSTNGAESVGFTLNNPTGSRNMTISVTYEAPVKVTNISLNKTAVTLRVGQTFQLEPTLTPADAANKTVTYTSSSAGRASVSNTGLITAVSRAGAQNTATITARATNGTTSTSDDATATCRVTIYNQLNVSNLFVGEISEFTYDGEAKEPELVLTDTQTNYTLVKGVDYDIAYSNNVNATTTDNLAVATVTGKGGYTGTRDITFAISKADVEPTLTVDDWTYGETYGQVSFNDPANRSNDATYFIAKKGTDDWEPIQNFDGSAGEYTMKAELPATQNYTADTVTDDFTVFPAEVTITADDQSSTYGEALNNLSYTISGSELAEEELDFELSTTATSTSNAGEYPITVSYTPNSNFSVTTVPGTYIINKAGLTVTASGYTGDYDGKAHSITVDVGDSDATVYYGPVPLDEENYLEEGSTENPSFTNANEYNVFFYVVSNNYAPDPVSGMKTVEIDLADPLLIDPVANEDLSYTGDPLELVIPGEAEFGPVLYALGTDAENEPEFDAFSEDLPTATEAGTYYVWYGTTGDENHYSDHGHVLEVKINKAAAPQVLAPAGNTDLVANGEAQPLVTPGESDEGTVLYALGTDDTTVPSDDAWSEDVPTASEAGTYYVWYKVIGDDNHDDVEPECIVVEIAGEQDESSQDESSKDESSKDDSSKADSSSSKADTSSSTTTTTTTAAASTTNPGTGATAAAGLTALLAAAAVVFKKKK